jgi:CubicO group peptidase (beta-lactamase class C family)
MSTSVARRRSWAAAIDSPSDTSSTGTNVPRRDLARCVPWRVTTMEATSRLRWLRTPALILAGVVAWVAFVFVATLHDWWRRPIAPHGDAHAFAAAARGMVEERLRGNLAMVVVDRGRVVAHHYASVDAEEPIGPDTIFQVASVSKWVTAWGVLSLVDRGLVDLDAPVERYLTRWHLPPSDFDHGGVTVRRLLSHTAGLVDGLGYAGFEDPDAVQPLEESLAGAADSDFDRDGVVRVGLEPGAQWRYSGGGYTVLQLLIEEVSGVAFAEYMRRDVLEPLGMDRSAYGHDGVSADELAAHFADGVRVPHRYFTAQAAAALHTTASDVTRFLVAHLEGPAGEPPGRGVITERTLVEMMTPHGSQFGLGIWGLGPLLYGPALGSPRVVGHDGFNAPGISSTARLDLSDGSGIIVLSSGDPRLAPDLGSAWVYHRIGSLDVIALSAGLGRMITLVAVGAAAVPLAGVAVALVGRARQRRGPSR